jgi:hypothetical protein
LVLRIPPKLEFPMREKRRIAAPATARATKASTEPMTSGYALVVDGHVKTIFEAKDGAVEAGRELKARFPHLQVKIFDAETKRSEAVEIASA